MRYSYVCSQVKTSKTEWEKQGAAHHILQGTLQHMDHKTKLNKKQATALAVLQ